VSVGFTPAGTSPDLNLYTGPDTNSLVTQGGNPIRTSPTATPTQTPTPSPLPTPGATGTATATPTASPTPADLGTDTLSRSVNLAS
jgi:hypothetical protein